MSKLSVMVRHISPRHFSLSCGRAAICWPKPDYGPMEVQRSEFMNGVKVAAARPMGHQIAACTIMYEVGSRNETDDQLGATHFIRACANGTGCGYSSFAKMRTLQQLGGYVTCASDRQTIAFTLRCPLTTFPQLKNFLMDMAVRGCYNQWEVDDRKPIIRDQLAAMPPEQRVLDLVQRACWTGPLAHSIFCEEERVGPMTEDSLNCFAYTQFKTNRCTVASFGLPFEETLKMAESIEFRRDRPAAPCAAVSCPRGGFELHDLGPGSDTWIAVAVPGCGTCDLSCLMKHALVAAACGTGNTQVGQHLLDRIPQSPLGLMAGADVFTEYKAFNISYKETGVFGILAKTRACTARDVALAAAEFLANVGELDFKQIEVGKNRLKLSLAQHDEHCELVSEGLALQLASGVQLDSATNSLAIINNICPDEIKCTAGVIASKQAYMSVAVVGDVGAVPHDRELVCGL